ncbi:MAG: hypothetical protein KA226_05855 [Gemmatimonadales bacterium]|nr:hypothetical protein [Gemmatimonadales bacterium]
MKLRNINPLGQVDLPLLGRTLEPGEEFDVDDAVAGRPPSGTPFDDGEPDFDMGAGLLAQVGNFEVVEADDAPDPTRAPLVEVEPAPHLDPVIDVPRPASRSPRPKRGGGTR